MEINIEQIIEGRKNHVKLEEYEYRVLSEKLRQIENTEEVKTYLEKKDY